METACYLADADFRVQFLEKAVIFKHFQTIRTEGLLTIDEAFAGLDEEKQDPREG